MAVKNLGYTPDLRPIFLNSQYAFFGTHHPSEKLKPSLIIFSLQPSAYDAAIFDRFYSDRTPVGQFYFLANSVE